MTNKGLGIDNIKTVLIPFFKIIAAAFTIDSNNDGKTSLFEISSFVGFAGFQMIPVASQFDEFADETKDLTADEFQEVMSWVEAEFPTIAAHPNFTEIVKGSLRWVRETTRFLQVVKAIK